MHVLSFLAIIDQQAPAARTALYLAEAFRTSVR